MNFGVSENVIIIPHEKGVSKYMNIRNDDTLVNNDV